MKCDELKVSCYTTRSYNTIKVYDIDEVDAAIAELKAENERLKEANHELQVDLEGAKATAYADSVDAGMREHRLRRALWLARAERATDKQTPLNYCFYCEKHPNSRYNTTTKMPIPFMWWKNLWQNVEQLCRKKAENY